MQSDGCSNNEEEKVNDYYSTFRRRELKKISLKLGDE